VSEAPPARRRLGRRLLLLAIVAAAALAGPACSKKSLVFRHAPVVLISVDTLRADRLPVYGYRGVETPALDALAADSIVFENAVSQVPLTLPSHVSLATFLAARGYAAGAAVSSVVLDHSTGVGQGFELYDDSIEGTEAGQALGQVQRSGGETARRLQTWIGDQPSGRPLFAFLHLFEPHSPYEPPEPFRSRYAKSPYDGEIAAADEIVGHFLVFLKERGLYDSAVIVFLSDHGEGLGDHGEDEHGTFLYRSTVRVPLFVKLPRRRLAGTRVGLPAQLTDVYPTVVAAVGEELPAGLAGASLIGLAQGRVGARSVYSETLFPRYHFGWSDLASLTDDRHQYIQAPRPELYDWREDPGEEKNLASSLPPAFRKLRVELQGMSRPLQAPGTADPETVKKLASLGYIGQASPAPGETDLPDPKDRIGTLAILKDANRLASAHRDDEAVAMLRKFVAENPRMLDGWEVLARTLKRAGRPQEAIQALEQADRLSPGTSQIVMGLANLNLEARNFVRARELAEAARALGATHGEEQLAAIALAEGDVAAARRHAESARAKSPEVRLPLLLLARVEARSGNHPAALERLDELLLLERQTNAPPISGVRAARGDVLAHLGRDREAEEDFRREIRDFPENLDAWSRLALLYASEGRTGEFRSLLTEMTRRVPSRRSYEMAAKISEIVGDQEGIRYWRTRPRPGAAS
jgi:choline-sulfatase